MATLTVTTVDVTDADPAMAAADAGGDQYLGTKNTALVVYNGDASSINVTLTSQVTDVAGITADDLVVAVPGTEHRVITLGSHISKFKDSNGYVQVAYSAVTSVEVAAIELG